MEICFTAGVITVWRGHWFWSDKPVC